MYYISPWCFFLNLVLYARSLHVDSPPHIPSLTSSYVHGTSSISLLPLTVSQSLDSTVQRWPDREAVVFLQDGVRKTFAQFQQDVRFGFSAFSFCFQELSCMYQLLNLIYVAPMSLLFQ